MKACRVCGEIKVAGEFYKHPKMKGGRDSKCKECTKAAVKANRDKKIDYYKHYDAWRFQNDPRVRERHARYRNTEDCMKSMVTSRAKYDNANPEKRAAHVLLGNAVRDGRVIKPENCSACGNFTPSRRLHGHHEDYAKPLEVVWLCIDCHSSHHNPQNEDFTPIRKSDKTKAST